MAGIRVEKVSKRFGKVEALKGVDLEVRDQEFLVLLGPSGCGKTTLLRIVAGLEAPTSGEVYIGERRVTHLPPRLRGIAMVFQNYALYPHMNVYENMAFGLRLRRGGEIDDRLVVGDLFLALLWRWQRRGRGVGRGRGGAPIRFGGLILQAGRHWRHFGKRYARGAILACIRQRGDLVGSHYGLNGRCGRNG